MENVADSEIIEQDEGAWKTILDNLIASKVAEIFLEPVPWESLGLTDYLEVVKTPMDLGTIKKRLEAHQYASFEGFKNDVTLVINNCKIYNPRNSDVHKMGIKLEREFEKQVSKAVKKSGGTGKINLKVPSAEEKDKFCKTVYTLRAIELGKIIEMLDELCPSELYFFSPLYDG